MSGDLFYQVDVSAGGASYDLAANLSSFTIEEVRGQPSQLDVSLCDPFKVFSHALQEGMEIEVVLGTDEASTLMFRGRIYKVDADFPDRDVPTLSLTAYDNALRMGLRTHNRPWTDMRLSEVVQAIAGEHFTQSLVTLDGDPGFSRNGVRQQDETDLGFLLRLAEEFGCELFVEPGDAADYFQFVSQRSLMSAEPEVVLYHGRTGVSGCLHQFRGSGDLNQVQLPRSLGGIDAETGELVEVTETTIEDVGDTEDLFVDDNLAAFGARYPGRVSALEGLIAAAPSVQAEVREELGATERSALTTFITEQELRTRAQNQFSISVHGMRGSGSTAGNTDIHAHRTIRLDDLGGRFSGVWYVARVRHIVDQQGYRTDFECQR